MKLMIFDTETIGKVSQDLLNIGYEIIDLNIATHEYVTLCEKDYLTRDLFNNQIYMLNDDFVGQKKYDKYVELVANKEIKMHSIQRIMGFIKNDIEKFGVERVYAYNSNFDIDKFIRTCGKFEIENPLEMFIESGRVHDLWAYAVNFIVTTEDYKTWCKDNMQYTESMVYIKSSVESVIRYLDNNVDFEEDHTALSDVRHERRILIECLKRGCNIEKDMKRSNIKSGYEFKERLVLPSGEEIDLVYKTKYTRNGKTTYKD